MDEELAVLFCLDGEEYAIPAGQVREILWQQKIGESSNLCCSCIGSVKSRGRDIPVISLSGKFGLDNSRRQGWVIIAEVGLQEVGILVDEVTEVQYLSVAVLNRASEASTNKASWLRGIGKTGRRLVSLLDLPQIFPESELSALVLSENDYSLGKPYIALAH